LHCQNESRANRHDSNHWKCIDAHRQHLLDCRPPPASIPDKRQSSSQGTEGVPKLNGKAAHIFDVMHSRITEAFNNGYGH
jgi:hypothetical protein